jgi:hypothetical protein
MSRIANKPKFSQREVTRLARAMQAAGVPSRIEISRDGILSAIPLVEAAPNQPNPAANAFDEVLHVAPKAHVRS